MSSRSRVVQDKIHRLRAEHFRHTQNLGLAPKTRAAPLTHNAPTLPADLFAEPAYSTDKPIRQPRPRDIREALFVCKERVERPVNPDLSTAHGRADALSVVLPAVAERTRVPSLTLLCLQMLVVSSSDAEFVDAVLPYIPVHLRSDLLRWTAVHRPLTNHELHALCSDGHVNGELIVVGPSASLRDNQFNQLERHSDEWDTDDLLPPTMHTVALLSVPLGSSTFFTLPPTLTHLALVNIPNPVPLHRLPSACPLVECLDLSYNTWLVAEKEAKERLDNVQWSRWHQLRVLGMRGCCIPAGMVADVNKGRWDDVSLVK